MFHIREKGSAIRFSDLWNLEGINITFQQIFQTSALLRHQKAPRNGDVLISVEEFAMMGLLQTKVHKETALLGGFKSG